MNLFKQITDMFSRELASHGRAFVNYQALSGVEVKDMTIDGFPAKLFFNPARVRSVMSDVMMVLMLAVPFCIYEFRCIVSTF